MSTGLSSVFNIEPIEVITAQSVTIVEDGSEDADFIYARSQTYNLIAKGAEALDIAMRIAKESENPRAIEVLSGLLKNLSEVNKSLVVLNKDKAEAKAAKIGQSSGTSVGTAINNQNIIFAGNSKDLNKLLAEHLKGN